MALSAKERKQKQLKREREELRLLDDSTYPYLATPFYERLESDPNWSDVTLVLELAGFEPPGFEDDRGPEAYVNSDALSPDDDPADTFPGSKGSIGRAEVMVDCLLNAAQQLAEIINRYKVDELDARKRELENSDLTDPDDRKSAFEKVAQIIKIQDELAKNVRRTLPIWKVKGL
ncbi:hypothetical protein [Roseivivax sp. CAU 1753]